MQVLKYYGKGISVCIGEYGNFLLDTESNKKNEYIIFSFLENSQDTIHNNVDKSSYRVLGPPPSYTYVT